MVDKLENSRIEGSKELITPLELKYKYTIDERLGKSIIKDRKIVSQIINGEDPRLLSVVGPCSIHDVDEAIEYAEWLSSIKKDLPNLYIVMRVYFEKPRTTIGWKGLINDPNLDGSFDMNEGLDKARKLLLEINKLDIPAATEFLDGIVAPYIADLISYGAIGARTTESQTHRELASGLSMPIGFKNGTDGGIQVAQDAIKSANSPHSFLSVNNNGKSAIYTTTGNSDGHVILRGGGKEKTNYDRKTVLYITNKLKEAGINPNLMIDLSHGNSEGDYNNQMKVAKSVAAQIEEKNKNIVGIMLEGNKYKGKQTLNPLEPLEKGVSITDAGLPWNQTEDALGLLNEAAESRKS